jgi:hypothetical protein
MEQLIVISHLLFLLLTPTNSLTNYHLVPFNTQLNQTTTRDLAYVPCIQAPYFTQSNGRNQMPTALSIFPAYQGYFLS